MKDKFAVSMFGQKRLSREGGIEIVVKELCTRMARDGCQVTCYNRSGHHVSGAEYDNKIEYDGIRQKFVPTIERKGLAAVSSSFFAALYSAFEKYDVILGPAAPTTAPKLGNSLSDPIKMYLGDIYTISVNLAGLPGISIPVGRDAKGLPVGMQLIGDCFQEKKLFQAAYTYECLTEKKWVSMYDKTEAAGKGEA